MDKSPIEQQKIKIDALREEMRGMLGHLYDNKEQFSEKVNNFIPQLDAYEKSGLVFNKEEIIKGIKESTNVNNKEEFVVNLLKILEPIIILKVTHSKIFSKVEREGKINSSGNIRLSEVLYTKLDDLNEESKEVYLHLAPAKDFMTKDGIEDFKLEVKRGLIELAKIIKSHPNIKKIKALSWIVAVRGSRERLEDLGFAFEGEASKEEREDFFLEDKRLIAKAFMNREDFLARYGN